MGVITVNIQMVRVDGGDDRDLRVQAVERAVELIGLGHYDVVVVHEEVGAVVAGDAAEEGRTAFAAFREDMGGQGRCRRLAVGAGDGEAALALRDLSEGEGALDHAVAFLAHEIQLTELVDGGRIDDEGVLHGGRHEVRTVLIVDGDSLALKRRRQVRRGLVIPRHRVSLVFEIPRQGTHSDAPDTDEIYVFHTSLFGFLRRSLTSSE